MEEPSASKIVGITITAENLILDSEEIPAQAAAGLISYLTENILQQRSICFRKTG